MTRGQVQLKKKSKKPIFVTIILSVLIIFLIVSTVRLMGKYKKAKEIYHASVRKHDELELLRDQLKDSVDELSDEQGQDRELRQKLRVVEEGEELIIIIPEEQIP